MLFRYCTGKSEDAIPQLLTRIEHITSSEPASGGLRKLNLLLEATSLLHSQLPLDSVLGTMLDHAVAVTDADRGLLLEASATGALKVKLARRSGGLRLPPESLTPSQTAIQLAIKQQSPVITEDLAQANMDLQAAQSIVAQRLRAVVVIPLWAMSRANTQESMINIRRGDFLGVLYLDSRRPAAFSKLDRQILDALAADAASLLCDHTEVGRYATVFFGILDQDGHLEFINAGHPSPFLIRRGTAEEAFTEGSFPVGLVPEARYAAACLKLEPGDTLVLFTDGVTEAMDPDEQLFGVPRLKEILTSQTECPLEQLQKCVLEAVETFTRCAHQADDLTLLIVRYRATAASVTPRTRVPAS